MARIICRMTTLTIWLFAACSEDPTGSRQQQSTSLEANAEQTGSSGLSEPRDAGVKESDLRGQLAEPKLLQLESPRPQRSSSESLADWAQWTDAIAVFVCAGAAVIPATDAIDLKTRYNLVVQEGIRGTPPTEVVLSGGEFNGLIFKPFRSSSLVVGQRYVGFFFVEKMSPNPPQLGFFAMLNDDDQILLKGELVALSAFKANLASSTDGGAQQ